VGDMFHWIIDYRHVSLDYRILICFYGFSLDYRILICFYGFSLDYRRFDSVVFCVPMT
jgi:hypothetical protein